MKGQHGFLNKLFGSSQVKFKRETRKQHPTDRNIQTITKTYSAPNREAAVAFLRTQNVTEPYVYIEVVTPSGIFGIDRIGKIYDSAGVLFGDSSSLLQNTTNRSHERTSMSILKKLFGDSATPTPKNQPASSQSDIPAWKALSEAFHDAAGSGCLGKIKAMLQDNPNLVFSRAAFFGKTPLHAAAGKGHKDVVEFLLAKGADVNVEDQNHQAPLHDAAGSGHKEVVKLLLAKGANVNAKMYQDFTPLHNAASSGHKDVVSLLLANKAAVNDRAGFQVGMTPLYEATENGHRDVAELLLANGANKNAMTDSSYKPSCL